MKTFASIDPNRIDAAGKTTNLHNPVLDAFRDAPSNWRERRASIDFVWALYTGTRPPLHDLSGDTKHVIEEAIRKHIVYRHATITGYELTDVVDDYSRAIWWEILDLLEHAGNVSLRLMLAESAAARN